GGGERGAGAWRVGVLPALAVWLLGFCVTVGGAVAVLTVSVAGLLVTAPPTLETPTRYLPASPATGDVRVKFAVLAPVKPDVLPAPTLTQEEPTSFCHWYFSPSPVAVTLNLAGWPAVTVRLVGWVVMVGGATNLNLSAVPVADVPAGGVTVTSTDWPALPGGPG